ncbi:MAG: hypothetical protein K8J08_03275 [Thermoanaerobaculia bacterium]|nr:hypothetical protein [Thermoanaerobaculia bacterium]
MKTLASVVSATIALTLAVTAGAQTPPTPASPPAAESPQAAPMMGHAMHDAVGAEHPDDMKAQCQAMMAKKQEMQDKLEALDATLDELVAEMNAAKTSNEADAMEKPMAAVLTELVAQRKASHAMMMEMQPKMMEHMGRHMDMKMHGAMGGMDCPMMKMGVADETEAKEINPKM